MSNGTVAYNSLAESALLLHQNYPLLYQVLLLLHYSKHDFFFRVQFKKRVPTYKQRNLSPELCVRLICGNFCAVYVRLFLPLCGAAKEDTDKKLKLRMDRNK